MTTSPILATPSSNDGLIAIHFTEEQLLYIQALVHAQPFPDDGFTAYMQETVALQILAHLPQD